MRFQYSTSILVLLALAVLDLQLTAGKVACRHVAEDSCEAADPDPEHAEAMLQVGRNPPHKAVVKDGAKHEEETRMTAKSAKRVDSSDDINEDAKRTKNEQKSDHDRKTSKKEKASSHKLSTRANSDKKQEDSLRLREKSSHGQHSGKKDEDLSEKEHADKKHKVGSGLRKKSGHGQNIGKKDSSATGIKKRNNKKQEDSLRLGEKYVQDEDSGKKEKVSSSKVSKKDNNQEKQEDGLKLKDKSNYEKTSRKKDDDNISKVSKTESSEKKHEEVSVHDHDSGKKGKDSTAEDREEEKDDTKQEWEERQHKLEQELVEARSELLEAKGQNRALLQQLQDAESKAVQRQAIFRQLADIEAVDQRTIYDQMSNTGEESKGNQLHIQEQDHEPTLAELLNKDLLSVEGAELKSNDAWIMKSDDKDEDSDALNAQDGKLTDKAKDKEADNDTVTEDEKKAKQDASKKGEEDTKKSSDEDDKKSNYDRLTQKGEGKASTEVTFEKLSKRSKDTKSTGKHSDKGH